MAAIFLYNHRRNKKLYRREHSFGFFLLILIVFCIIFLCIADKKIFEHAILQSKFVINNMINSALANAVDKIIEQENLTCTDFCNVILENGKINSMVANTILINKFCNKLAVSVHNEFLKLGPGEIKIPFGSIFSSLSGINLFNTLGPNFKIKVIPVGNALVDYETKFISAGINQTNFQIWLNVRFNSYVVNLLQKKSIVFQKKIPLVNTIINGTVPNAYIDGKKFLN